MGPKRMLPY